MLSGLETDEVQKFLRSKLRWISLMANYITRYNCYVLNYSFKTLSVSVKSDFQLIYICSLAILVKKL